LRIADIAELVSDGVEPADAGHLAYVGLEHVDPGIPTLSRTGSPSQVRSRKTVFRRGDVLYGKLRPYLDKAVLVDMDGMCSTDILVLRPKPDTDPDFLVSLLHTEAFIRHAAATTAGVNHPRTSWPAIREFELELPPLAEQRAIAHVLGTVQRARVTTEQAAAALGDLRRALLGYLFTYGPTPISEQADAVLISTDIGLCPAHWEVQPLGSVATLQRGKDLPADERRAGTVPVVGSDGIVGYHDRFVARAPGVCVTRSGSLRRVNWVKHDYWPLNTMLWVKDFHGNSEKFVFYLLSVFPYDRYVGGVSIPTLNRNLIHPVRVGAPPVSEQIEVAHMLEALDRKMAAVEQRRQALDGLFKSLLSELISGRRRVPDFVGAG
jgi:type I restriction enzyme S subunit